MSSVGCDTDCPLEKFLDLLEPTIYHGTIQQWRAQCDGDQQISGQFALFRRNLPNSVILCLPTVCH